MKPPPMLSRNTAELPRVSRKGIKLIVAKISSLPEAADALRLLVEGRLFGQDRPHNFDFAYKKNPIKTRG
jgi:hypothetical protein